MSADKSPAAGDIVRASLVMDEVTRNLWLHHGMMSAMENNYSPGGRIDHLDIEAFRAGRLAVRAAIAQLDASRAETDAAKRERDEAVKLLKKVSLSLEGLTPGGSEYISYSDLLDVFFADAERCVAVVRERFNAGHAAKIEAIDNKRLADAANARAEALAKSARAFVTKLDEVTPAINGAFTFQYVHGIEYAGPNYSDELSELRDRLAEIEEGKSP